MSKFRYYVTDLFDGKIVGTNNEADARSYSESEDHYVVDAQEGKWLVHGELHEVEEAKHVEDN